MASGLSPPAKVFVPAPLSVEAMAPMEVSSVAAGPPLLLPGDTVVICGLQSVAGLKMNGVTAAVERVDPSGRFRVRLLCEVPSFHRRLRI